jgi:hypothetical protein
MRFYVMPANLSASSMSNIALIPTQPSTPGVPVVDRLPEDVVERATEWLNEWHGALRRKAYTTPELAEHFVKFALNLDADPVAETTQALQDRWPMLARERAEEIARIAIRIDRDREVADDD